MTSPCQCDNILTNLSHVLKLLYFRIWILEVKNSDSDLGNQEPGRGSTQILIA